MKPNRGTLVLVLGILSLVICAPLGIVAWVMGNKDMKEIAAGTMDPAGADLVKIGRILGMVGTALLVLGVLFFFGMILLGLLGAGGAALSP